MTDKNDNFSFKRKYKNDMTDKNEKYFKGKTDNYPIKTTDKKKKIVESPIKNR